MSRSIRNEAGRVSANTLEQAAKDAVERALQARRAIVELTPEQARQVSGGVLTAGGTSAILKPPIIYGLWNPIDTKTLQSQTLPTLQR